MKKLKLKNEGFDYKNLPTPQQDAYRQWIKKQLVAGNGIVWLIMQPGERYPVYPDLPPKTSPYGHIEPVVGIMSDKPLNDTAWYDDDYVVHFTDADYHTYYRSMKSLPDNINYTGNCKHGHYTGYPCINDQYGLGWAIQELDDDKEFLPASLVIDPVDEPDVRTGSKPTALQGTLTVDGLTTGSKYAIYRWNSVETAFDYKNPQSVHKFTASATSTVYKDTQTFMSDEAAYYRCVPDKPDILV